MGPYFISDVVQGDSRIGVAYKLIHVESVKTYRRLVSGDRLKPYNVDRKNLLTRVPKQPEKQAV